jgi:hypothetical protein
MHSEHCVTEARKYCGAQETHRALELHTMHPGIAPTHSEHKEPLRK